MRPLLNCVMILESLLACLFVCLLFNGVALAVLHCSCWCKDDFFFFLHARASFPQGFESEQVETLQNFRSDYS